jgi:hypothetical protein
MRPLFQGFAVPHARYWAFEPCMVLRSTSKMTAVDQPNSNTQFIAVMGPSSRQRSTGSTSPYPRVV